MRPELFTYLISTLLSIQRGSIAPMSLNEIWDSAGGNPFYPLVSKNSHLFIASTLLVTCKFDLSGGPA